MSGWARGDHVELAEELVDEMGGKGNLVHDELHAWRYDETTGLWSMVDPARQSRILQSFAGAPIGEQGKPLKLKATDVVGAIRLANDQVSRPGYFADAAGVAFADCVVTATSSGIERKEHARENRVRAGYSFPFEKGACPKHFLTFLDDLFRDDVDKADKTGLVQEFGGACVLGIAPNYQRSIIGIGEGDNGKSALASVLLECMPPGTTSAIPPQDWGQEYRRAMLVGKHLNAVGELPEREILASEAFKAIVAGDPIVGRIIREKPLMFRPIAGHYFAANRLPGTTDQSEGFWRRFVALTFNRSFSGDPKRDPDIVSKVTQEKAAIVAWFIDGAVRLIQHRGYTIPSSHVDALAEWRKNANPVALFVETLQRLRDDETSKSGISGASLYRLYKDWCSDNGHRTLASNKFAERMQGLGLAAKRTNRGAVYPVAQKVTGSDGGVTGHPSPYLRVVPDE